MSEQERFFKMMRQLVEGVVATIGILTLALAAVTLWVIFT